MDHLATRNYDIKTNILHMLPVLNQPFSLYDLRSPYNCQFHGDVNSVDYYVGHTSVCNRPFHGKVSSVDYCLPIFDMCSRSFHGRVNERHTFAVT